MVSLLIVSHSARLADGVKEFVGQIAGDKIRIGAAGGTVDGSLGTSVERIQSALRDLVSDEGTLVLVDMGAAVMSVETALEELGVRAMISNAPLVEGAYFAAIEAAAGSTLEQTNNAALQACQLTKVHQ
ncbi:MAG TPA: dihydroxyacetone kinase phosphoryl donor subunit DhaM [Roseiflexaceae bacterium]|nr:dihydroxyacetone kinase phosphoryl donor subunit DhaM [Roseiflexaceae bacterium]